MMAADSLHVDVHLIVPSGVLIRWFSACRRACRASTDPAHRALHFAVPSQRGIRWFASQAISNRKECCTLPPFRYFRSFLLPGGRTQLN